MRLRAKLLTRIELYFEVFQRVSDLSAKTLEKRINTDFLHLFTTRKNVKNTLKNVVKAQSSGHESGHEIFNDKH